MERKKVGLLVMAYGTPYQEEDIIPYYTHIRHGKRPSDDMIEDLKKRYKHIGGISPLYSPEPRIGSLFLRIKK